MSESLSFTARAPREQIYAEIYPQVKALLAGETDWIANLANLAAILKEALQFLWVGFYRVQEGELVLGPFQGPLACTRIAFDRGVCGHAYRTERSVLVPDVHAFPGHIACSSASQSEIVVPIFDHEQNVIALLDVDSEHLNHFSEVDRLALESLCQLLSHSHFKTGEIS